MEKQKGQFIFSDRLWKACRMHAKHAKESTYPYEAEFANVSCLIVAPSIIEALLNEFISYHCVIDQNMVNVKDFFAAMKGTEKLRIEERWNLLAAFFKGQSWDDGKEPFQSYQLIKTFRNEIVHYKGDWVPIGEAPFSKMKQFISRFVKEEPNSSLPFSYYSLVLKNKDLGGFIFERTKNFYDNVGKLINAEHYEFFQSLYLQG